jgi:Metallo-beta-lactamase superfamily/Fn3 associated
MTLVLLLGSVLNTLDGSDPNARSPIFNPTQLLFIAGVYESDRGLKTGYTIRAIATKDGARNSDIATFVYTIERRDRTAYVSEEILPQRVIRDSDNDKMFLVKGSKKAALIDTGMGRGALKAYVAQYAGSLSLEVVLTHNHPDHIGQLDQFINDDDAYIGEADRQIAVQRLARSGIPADTIERNLHVARDGDRLDLGGRVLSIYERQATPPVPSLFSMRKRGRSSPAMPSAATSRRFPMRRGCNSAAPRSTRISRRFA